MIQRRGGASAAGRTWKSAIALGLIGWCAVNSGQAAEPAWKPEKSIELIATNAPGGGADRILRIMAKIIQSRRDFTVPITVVNKPGGGGSVSYAYLNQHPGDGHFVVLDIHSYNHRR